MKYYSAKTNTFYSEDVHGSKENMPSDIVEVEDVEWQALLAQSAEGKTVMPGTDGRPYAGVMPLSLDVKESVLRRQRDAALTDSDGLVARHRDECEIGEPTTLTNEQYIELQAWRRALRDLPSKPAWPNVELPQRPV